MAQAATKQRPRRNGPGVPRTPAVAPILNLDDLIEPGATWTFRGVDYEYVRWASLDMIARHRIDVKHRRVQALEELTEEREPTDEESAEYEALICDLVLLSTPAITNDVVEDMVPEQRANIVTYFLALRLARSTESHELKINKVREWIEATSPAPTNSPAASTTQESSSPDSIGSGRRAIPAFGSPSRTRSSSLTSAPSRSSRAKSDSNKD